MLNVDYDKTKFDADGYGNLIPKKIEHAGYTIDINLIGPVKVWDCQENFVGTYPDIDSAKIAIDNL